jgi:formamidopyrimidine-DNA glycosylase
MPELPHVVCYLEALERKVRGERLARLRIAHPFLLRSVDPPPAELEGRRLTSLGRLGKRLVLHFEGELHAVLHLMLTGRLRWREAGAAIPKRRGLAAFDFESGTVLLTEEGSKKRASLHLVRGSEALGEHDPGGLDVRAASTDEFAERLGAANHTLKRALTDPRLLDGIGNTFSDEILHRARFSPFRRTRGLDADEHARLHAACRDVLDEWTARLRDEIADGFPERVRARHAEMAVHGKFKEPCPVCGDPVQRIVWAANESFYCATCQTGGKLLADRALSRLLKDDWPRTVEEWEQLGRGG